MRHETLWQRMWRTLAMFCYRRWATPVGRIPDGVPGIRDSEARCTGYEPRKRRGGDWDCRGDGHYLCKECCHLTTEDNDD